MNAIVQILDLFGLRQTPWIMRVYLVLLFLCARLIVGSTFHLPDKMDDNVPYVRLFEFAMDSFKFVLGAVIGSLSMAASAHWAASGADGSDDKKQLAGKQ